LNPTAQAVFDPSARAKFYRLLRHYALPYWKAFAGLVALNLALAAVTLLVTVFTAAVLDMLDRAAGPARAAAPPVSLQDISIENVGEAILHLAGIAGMESGFQAILILAGVILALFVLKCALEYGGKLLGEWISLRTARAIQFDLFRHLLGFSLGFFNKSRTGDLLSRLEMDTKLSVERIQPVVQALIVAPILLVIYSLITLRASWLLFLCIPLAGLIHYGISAGLNNPIRTLTVRLLDRLSDLKLAMLDTLASIRVVKSFGTEDDELRALDQRQRANQTVSLKHKAADELQKPARDLANQIVLLVVVLFAARELFAGNIQTTTALFFIYICKAFMEPVRELGAVPVHLGIMVSSAEKVDRYFGMSPAVRDGARTVCTFREALRFEGVSFAYEAGETVLRGIALEVPKGRTVALVGPSGAGKSTLVDLALRFYDPTEGRITLDGTDLRELRQRDYRRLFGVVSQENLLLNASVRDNIAYGRGGLTDGQIHRAARAANAHAFIEALPRGYATPVGERGVALSGGQRQRIAIARALVAEPEILVLDEATSSLDSHSEREVQRAIELATAGTTAIVIAHRLATILRADRILYLENGEILARGTHAELYENCAPYRALVDLQFRGETVPA